MYTADVQLPDMLHVAMLRSSVAHGRVQSLELDAALRSPGVHGAYCLIRPGSTIRFWGQELIAVAAESYELARQALDKIVVTVEEQSVVASIDAALAPNAPLIYAKEQRKEASSAA